MPFASKKARTKEADAFYCVLQSEDGARIITDAQANELKSMGTVHFAGDLSCAQELQKTIEKTIIDRLVERPGRRVDGSFGKYW
jgi:hypothetical protein